MVACVAETISIPPSASTAVDQGHGGPAQGDCYARIRRTSEKMSARSTQSHKPKCQLTSSPCPISSLCNHDTTHASSCSHSRPVAQRHPQHQLYTAQSCITHVHPADHTTRLRSPRSRSNLQPAHPALSRSSKTHHRPPRQRWKTRLSAV